MARTHAERRGRDPRRLQASGAPADLFQGTAEQVTADIRAYAAVGVTHFVFDSTHQDMSAVLANMERFAKDVMPGFAPRARRPATKARVAPRKVARRAKGKR